MKSLSIAVFLTSVAVAVGAAPLSQPEGMDADGDGRVSVDEHEAAARKMFEAMDADGDGHLSKSEWEKGHAALMRSARKE
jgi:hypothetical protein